MSPDYFCWDRPGKVNYICYFGEKTFSSHEMYFGYPWPDLYVFFFNRRVNAIWNVDEHQETGKRVILQFLDKGFFQKKKKEYQKVNEKFEKAWKKTSHLSSFSNKKFIQSYQEFADSYYDWWGFTLVAETFSQGSEKLGREILGRNFDRYFHPLVMPRSIAWSSQEEMSRLHLLDMIQSNPRLKTLIAHQERPDVSPFQSFYRALKAHTKKFFWVKNDYVTTIALDERYFLSELRKMVDEGIVAKKELQNIQARSKKFQEEKKRILQELKLTQKEKNIFRLIEWFVFFQDDRKMMNQKGNYYASLFCTECARRCKVPLDIIEGCLPTEISVFLDGQGDISFIKKRNTDFLYFWSKKSNKIITGKESTRMRNEMLGISEHATSITGLPAQKGKVHGKVRLILDPLDAHIEKGEVLVTTMTSPDFIHLMRKASAIVTDEGGVTCHAAIVCREFGIPCIIGTKMATKIFKNGDWVEVDANKGVVRKLK